MKCSLQIVSLVTVLIHGLTLNAQEQQQSAPPPPLTEKGINQEATALLKTIVTEQDAFLKRCGSIAGFRKMAETMLHPSEKMTQVVNAVNGYDKRTARVKALFEKYIVDHSLVHNRLHSAFRSLQTKLIKDTVALCVQHGVPEQLYGEKITIWTLKEKAFANSYQSLVEHGVRISRSDWFRTAAAFVGSRVAADTTESIARTLGLWNHEEGGLMDNLLNSTLNFAAEVVIEKATQPSDELARHLKKMFDDITRTRLYDKHGFQPLCKQIVDHHIKVRAELLGMMKGSTK